MAAKSYYDTLGISRTASDDEIKKAYRKLAKKYHPDSNKGDKSSEAKFKEVQEAYDVLSDKEKRSQYDTFGRVGGPHPSGTPGAGTYTYSTSGGPGVEFDFADFSDLFESAGNQRRGRGGGGSIFDQIFERVGRRGAHVEEEEAPGSLDIEQDVSLTFEQAIRGVSLEIRIVDGPAAGQVVTVKIPPGMDDGQRIRVRGKGGHGRRGQPPGDLYIRCRVQPHAYFRRVGADIYLEVPITVAEATLGAKVDIPTISGPTTVKLPAGTASGTKLRLSGRGVENPKTKETGDQYAVIKIVPPRKLTDKQLKLMQDFADSLAEDPRGGLWNF